MTLQAEAKAPAKVILVGEHFCVHGAPAVSMAINLYARVKVRRRAEGGVKISAKNLPPGFTLQIAGRKVDALQPLRLAVEEVLRKAAEKISKRLPGLEIEASSEIPIGAGLGSSASLASATIAAAAKVLGLTPSRETIIELCSIPERFIHGNPSGVDQTTVVLGGIIIFRRGEPPVSLSP
ncbi:MAG: mevalonate kinase family protein, partial [Candidatus Hecatellaceae archaeon]